MDNKILMASITSVVVVVLLATVLVPVIDDTKNDYMVNNGEGSFSLVTSGDVELSYSSNSSEKTFTINGEIVDRSTSTYTYYAPIIADTFVVTAYMAAGTMHQTFCYVNEDGTYTKVVTTGYDVSVTISGHQAVINYDETTQTITFSWVGYYSSDGDYVQQSLWAQHGSCIQYYNDIDQIRGAYIVETTGLWYSFIGDDVKYGTDSVTADYVNEKVDGTENVYSQIATSSGSTSGYSFTVDDDGSDYIVAPLFYLVPKTVEGTTTTNAGMLPILQSIPVMVIIALIVAIVGLFVIKKE